MKNDFQIPLVSIITPVFNHEQYLEQYFNSILIQDYENIELIIIDDASTDQSWNVILEKEQYLKNRNIKTRFSRNDKNIGLLKSMESLIEYINGDYVKILESDDFLHKSMITNSVEYLVENENFSSVHSDINMKYDDKTIERYWKSKGKKIPVGEIFQDLLNDNFIYTCSLLVKSEYFFMYCKIEEYYKKKYLTMDYPFCLDLSSNTNIGYINRALSTYRVVKNSISHPVDIKEEFEWKNSYYRIKIDYLKKYGAKVEVANRLKRQFHYNQFNYGYQLGDLTLYKEGFFWLLKNHKKFNSIRNWIKYFIIKFKHGSKAD